MTTADDIKAAHFRVLGVVAEVEGRVQHEVLPGAERDTLQKRHRKLKDVARQLWDAYNPAAAAEREIPDLQRIVKGKRKAVSLLTKDLAKAEHDFTEASEELTRGKNAAIRLARDNARAEIDRLESAIQLLEFGPRDARAAGLSFWRLDDRLLAVIEQCGLRERDVISGTPLVTGERQLEIAGTRLSVALEQSRRLLESVGIVVAEEATASR